MSSGAQCSNFGQVFVLEVTIMDPLESLQEYAVQLSEELQVVPARRNSYSYGNGKKK